MADATSARIYHLEAPQASPGSCGVCGKSSHDQGFTAFTNLDFEFYGSLIFCYDCSLEIGRLQGMITDEDMSDLTRRVEAQDQELATLREAQLLTENIVDNLQRLTALTGNSLDDLNAVGSITSAAVLSKTPSDIKADVEEGAGPLSAGDDTDSGLTQSVDEQGPDDVRDSTDELLATLDI